MKEYSVFDIIGPIMIGPSSSHTAGAARLGKIAKAIAGGEIENVDFLLHGSFSKTYKGHGTDRALVAGILGLDPWDERLRDSISIAEEQGISIRFLETDLGDVHPNTVKFLITLKDNTLVEVVGSSIGGGNIIINEVDDEKLEFSGNYPTLIIKHKDLPGMISKVSEIISKQNINIAFLKVLRTSKGQSATMIFETDSTLNDDVVNEINTLNHIENVRMINPAKKGEENYVC
ncbi:L-serine ammonia-lyase, iron-sulfur-dependent subunit beta [Clostridium cellulovorans]|uniref:L-serine deaminase n=1 Tax=Clostridium cellulovorans (strain ATCC 35296 / DSM 3052 / OCM 3 / 743B) TaxID=573061 RepID=D9SP21_CLOC7|nr:L-serine ammonia-lyase, iron-sulfur-dependent subunit beta [Clostridium cellulovorans]ADL51986.1 L-serine dehydratase, iron-sulfur-dependent, beta subunit [Clostridium cellulovorans 743B]